MSEFGKLGIAVRTIARADASAVERLGRAGVATVHEAHGRTGLMQPYLRPVWPAVTSVASGNSVPPRGAPGGC